MTNEQVAAALTALGPELAFPPTPSLRGVVLARLETERAPREHRAGAGRVLGLEPRENGAPQ